MTANREAIAKKHAEVFPEWMRPTIQRAILAALSDVDKQEQPSRLRHFITQLTNLTAKIARREYLPNLEKCRTIRDARRVVIQMEDKQMALVRDFKTIIDCMREVEAAHPISSVVEAAPADEVCDRCFEVSDKALELVGIAENADFEEGCGAVFELRQLLPNLDKYIRWEVSDEVAKYCPACSGQHAALIHVECHRCEKHCPCKPKAAAPQSEQPTQQLFEEWFRKNCPNVEPLMFVAQPSGKKLYVWDFVERWLAAERSTSCKNCHTTIKSYPCVECGFDGGL
jgi:hypothetical protein